MRLHRVEIAGFGPFRERQVVDFDQFADDGIFLISGRTGAGKSSILDAVCFALYGSAPRYDSGPKRLRSDHCAPEDPTEVALEFTTADRRLRVVRSPEYERPKRRGDGVTTEGAKAQIFEWVDGDWIGRESGPRDVALFLDGLLGLDQQQFLQVILLAQNRFSRFLLAGNDERQAVLRTLFDTRRYHTYGEALESRRRDAAQTADAGAADVTRALDDAEAIVARLDADTAADVSGAPAPAGDISAAPPPAGDISAAPPSGGEGAEPEVRATTAERLTALDRAVRRIAYRAEAAARDRDAADEAHRVTSERHDTLRRTRELQDERAATRATLQAAEAEVAAMATAREDLTQARRADVLRPTLDAATRAQRALEDAIAAEAEQHARWARSDTTGVPTPPEVTDLAEADLAEAEFTELEAWVAGVIGDIAVWEKAVDTETALPELSATVEQTLARIATIDSQRKERLAEADAIPARIAVLDEDLARASRDAGVVDAATADTVRLRTQLDAARRAADLEHIRAQADTARTAAAAAVADAASRVVALLQHRTAQAAGELASALVDGEPCPVCGACEHPAPAPPGADPVTDAMIQAAEESRTAAVAADADAAHTLRVAEQQHATAHADAGGRTVADLESAVALAESAEQAAVAAVARRDTLVAERAEASARAVELTAEVSALTAEHAAATEALAAAKAAVRTATETVTEARGDFASVSARVGAARELHTLATERVRAGRARLAAADTAGVTAADVTAAIAESHFADESEVRAALLPESAQARLDEMIRTHDSARAAAKTRLLELELALADQPEDLVDLGAAAAAVSEARSRWSAAVDAAAMVSQHSDRLRQLLDEARAAHDSVAALREEEAAITRLADTVAGRAPNTHRMDLETFVLAAELEEIVAAANLRLEEMSSGRYRLQHTDARAARGAASGLGLEVMDAHTGRPRPTHSLSGGETFLASLALALGLAEVVTARAGGLRLDTLFIDEGFGSLDGDALELAMRTLDDLRVGGRTVGVISHVDSMKEQLRAQLRVDADAQGPSTIRVGMLAAP